MQIHRFIIYVDDQVRLYNKHFLPPQPKLVSATENHLERVLLKVAKSKQKQETHRSLDDAPLSCPATRTTYRSQLSTEATFVSVTDLPTIANRPPLDKDVRRCGVGGGSETDDGVMKMLSDPEAQVKGRYSMPPRRRYSNVEYFEFASRLICIIV